MSMKNKKTIEDIDVAGKRVIVRVDFNVPLDADRNITDDKRIVGALPTIKYLVDKGAKTILVSHLGRPKDGFEDKYSMKPTAVKLGQLLGKEVIMAKDVIGEDAKAKAAALKDGEVLMLENVRFHKEETKNDPGFAKQLASMAEIFVNDAFGTAHRAHASTAGLADYLPAVCGYLIKKEIDFMGKALANPARPFVAILGGAKVSDKIAVIENLIDKVDTLIIGGGMAYTFLKAKGYHIGNSICEDDKLELAKTLMAKAEAKGVNLMLPIGSMVAQEFKNDTEIKYVPSDAMPDGWMGMDIGSLTIEKFSKEIRKAKTVIWNGPMGVFEFPNFATGTKEVAKAVAESGALSIVGGGDSAAAVEQLGFADKITHISTGGGASLEFLEGKVLPGIAVLMDKNPRKTIAAGNWKMNKTPKEAVAFVNELKASIADASNEVVVGVPFVCLPGVVEAVKGTNIKVAAQNMHWEEKGAYTGEVSGPMLADLGVDYVIIGHSERREYFGETNEMINKKAHAIFNYGMTPIICCGETLTQREQGVTADHVRYQIKVALLGLTAEQVKKTVIAYEPIWAIGTGKTATNEQANEVCGIIRQLVCELYGEEVAEQVRVQYGGSVNAKNAAELFAMSDIDGGLVGGASLKVDEFTVIANA
ncbi:triose-phosphate isomerase [Ruminiclostridium cellobioparum]|uniref:Multifunctional fusion protein n=1 Tax=Ruminiclostridium cellobioparum subsp. termitidis CT1112 TaxID=1195236 RepID=S0FHS1_RUMCE|nr:triose-phosphate isomerase [Ruminiclostridium cellobioparum]EMS69511.1 bifunctional phosphoglycerate kinase/triosephosphate isomerase [Ruminiclostridium cellobioparum subsp. termitidis CT1112]